MRCSIRLQAGVLIAAAAVVFGSVSAARGADVVVDAKRRAAVELMRDGKVSDAVSLINEVLKADNTNYRDYLLRARAYDKLNKASDAVESYNRVLELLPNSSGGAEERSVKAEADKRIKILDAQVIKIRNAEEEFIKKLDVLEREAIAARDIPAIRRIFRLKGGIYKAGGRRDRTGLEIVMAHGWQNTDFVVKAGVTYRIRAAGTFQIRPGLESTADGTGTQSGNGVGALGMLIGQVEGKADYIKLGSSARLTPEQTGSLTLLLNSTSAEEAKCSGGVTVLIEQE
jgi:tetratricopeptide (TPR) repeat protein